MVYWLRLSFLFLCSLLFPVLFYCHVWFLFSRRNKSKEEIRLEPLLSHIVLKGALCNTVVQALNTVILCPAMSFVDPLSLWFVVGRIRSAFW